MGSPACLTSLNTPRFCSQICQVHICFPAINDRVWVFARSFSCGSVCHGHLESSTALFVATALHKHSGNLVEFIYCPILNRELNSASRSLTCTARWEELLRARQKGGLSPRQVTPLGFRQLFSLVVPPPLPWFFKKLVEPVPEAPEAEAVRGSRRPRVRDPRATRGARLAPR